MIHRRGRVAAYESKSEDARFSCVFEDDGSSGYLYVLDHTDGSAQPIKDAVNLYQVDAANDIEHSIEFRWSPGAAHCGVYFQGTLEAFVDFEQLTLCAKSNFPAVSLWTKEPRAIWSTAVEEFMRVS